MTSRSPLRWLLALGLALAVVAMHAGLAGSCAAGGSAAPTVTAGHGHPPAEPSSPAHLVHGVGSACSATLPSSVPGPAELLLLAVVVGTGLLPLVGRAPLRFVPAVWWPPPPTPSFVCVWRI